MSQTDKVNEIRERINKMRDELKSAVIEAFEELSSKIFEEHSEIQSFSVRCYAPSFNDGAPCHVFLHSDDIEVNDVRVYDIECSIPSDTKSLLEYKQSEDFEEYNKEYGSVAGFLTQEIVGKITYFWDTFSENELESIFVGTGILRVNRDGTREVEWYDDY